jgi:hypothetical protein
MRRSVRATSDALSNAQGKSPALTPTSPAVDPAPGADCASDSAATEAGGDGVDSLPYEAWSTGGGGHWGAGRTGWLYKEGCGDGSRGGASVVAGVNRRGAVDTAAAARSHGVLTAKDAGTGVDRNTRECCAM